MKKNLLDLMQKAKEITMVGLPFMEGKEKGDTNVVIDTNMTLEDYGYMEGDEGEYVVFIVKEYPNLFFNGSGVITSSFKKLDEGLNEEEIKELLNNDLIIRIEKAVSKKNGKEYKKIIFYPSEE